MAVPAAAAAHLAAPGAHMTYANLPIAQMHAPVAGPQHPAAVRAGRVLGGPPRNHGSGHVVDTSMSAFHFDDQLATFDARGYAAAPPGGRGGGGMVGDVAAAAAAGGATVMVPGLAGRGGAAARGGGGAPFDPAAPAAKRRREAADAKAAKRAADVAEAAAVVASGGAWTLVRRAPWADRAVAPAKPTEEQVAWLKAEGFIKEEEEEGEGGEDGGAGPLAVAGGGASTSASSALTGTSKFHGAAEVDELGRSWMVAPRGGRKAPPEACSLPRRQVASWAAHGKGTSVVRFFPGTGHLLLTTGLDGKAKVWDARSLGGGGGGPPAPKLLRSYSGSTRGIRDAAWSGDGARFAAASYDKVVKLWDAETGKVLAGLGAGSKAMFYCAVFHPDPDKSGDVILAGCGDKKVYQWDARTGEAVQVYDYHLGPVNTVTFFDGGRKFATSSDDKTVRVWEYGIPVQVKLVADPGMHAIPAMTAHPGGGHMVGTSMDNTIVTFATTGERFKSVPKKTFKGHAVAGYACRPAFSPDGRYLVSGDGEGKAFYWDWRSGKVARSVQAHDGVCIDAAWHPLEASRMVTAGWDGVVKCWE